MDKENKEIERPQIAHQLDPYKHIEKLPKYGKRQAGMIISIVLQIVSFIALLFAVAITMGTGLLNLVDTTIMTGWIFANDGLDFFFAAALFSVIDVALSIGAMLLANYSKKSDDKKIAKISKYASLTALALVIVGLIVDVVALIANFT